MTINPTLSTRSSRASRNSALKRSFAMVIVLWAVAISAVALAAMQLSASRQASAGREAAARVRAYWAAQAGVQATLARLQAEADQATPLGTTSLIAALAEPAQRDLESASYAVFHSALSGSTLGPTDPHAKLNVNLATYDDLMLIPNMTEEAAYAILDWIDADEDPNPLGGAEFESYSAGASAYKPRNGPITDLRELELIVGIDPEMVRGEDWNQNNILDPNENDGDASFPPDNADGILDAGFSALLTASSVDLPVALDNQPKIDLTQTTAEDLVARIGITDLQAQVIAAYGQQSSSTMAELTTTNLQQIQQTLQQQGALTINVQRGQSRTAENLSNAQLAAVLDNTQFGPTDASSLRPGKININTVAIETLESVASIDPSIRDSLLLARDQAAGDLDTFADLLTLPSMTRARLAEIYPIITLRSGTFTLTSRGKDTVSGTTVDITTTLDMTVNPVIIRSSLTR